MPLYRKIYIRHICGGQVSSLNQLQYLTDNQSMSSSIQNMHCFFARQHSRQVRTSDATGAQDMHTLSVKAIILTTYKSETPSTPTHTLIMQLNPIRIVLKEGFHKYLSKATPQASARSSIATAGGLRAALVMNWCWWWCIKYIISYSLYIYRTWYI